jgi:CHASE1-domain containing sensor protein/CheY-like chemotaxis protein/anti-sigma regulatory factor (Ser/Thr protein kinase)
MLSGPQRKDDGRANMVAKHLRDEAALFGFPAQARWGPLLVLLLGLLVTALLGIQLWRAQVTKERERFRFQVEQTENALLGRVDMYATLLRGMAGLFAASHDVTPEEFRLYVDGLQIRQAFPGLQGLGYSRRLSPEEVPVVEQSMRQHGLAGFKVWPAGARAEYHSIMYLEPLDERNRAALGYDMHSEAVRRTAMDRACDAAQPVASGRVALVQDFDAPNQAGLLLYMPIYRNGQTPATVAERREALLGYTYAPIRANAMLDVMLGRAGVPGLDVAIYDGATSDSRVLMHRHMLSGKPELHPRFTEQRTLLIAGRPWTLQFSTNLNFDLELTRAHVYWELLGGIMITLLLHQLMQQQARARRLVEIQAMRVKRSEASMRESEARLQTLNQSLEERVAERTELAERRTAQLRRLASDLTQAEQHERRRLAQMLHDHLQQYLYATKLRIGRIFKQVADQPPLHRDLTQVETMLSEMLHMTRSMTMELHPPVLADRGLAPALDWLARQMLKEHDLEVDVQADSAVMVESEDLSLFLLQATRELLFNVVKHSGTNKAHVILTQAGEQVVITVRDQGKGFDLGSELEKTHAGESLGLFSLQQRLEILGGSLEIETRRGGGTAIWLRAPMQSQFEPTTGMMEQRHITREQDSSRLGGALRRLRVVLADDHAIVREGLRNLLRDEADMDIVGEAADGEEAVALTRKLRPDVVVMDISMPRLNGIEATRRIKAELPAVRVIGLSMHEEADMALAMREAGAENYLSKDAPSTELLRVIREAAGQG